MKTYLLWLLILLVVLQAYIALETSPELHMLSHDAYLKQLDEISKSTNGSQNVVNIAYNEYFNGRYGRYLVVSTLIIDLVMFCLLVHIIKLNRRSSKGAPGDKEDRDASED